MFDKLKKRLVEKFDADLKEILHNKKIRNSVIGFIADYLDVDGEDGKQIAILVWRDLRENEDDSKYCDIPKNEKINVRVFEPEYGRRYYYNTYLMPKTKFSFPDIG